MSKNFAETGLIEPDELAALIENGKTPKIVDATYLMPGSPVSGADLHFQRRIDGAVYFDIDDIADPAAPLAHTAPSADLFAEKVSELGISNDDLVVVYDQSGIAMAASRVWWMFRLYGHDNVCVLNGGLPYWEATGHALASGEPAKPSKSSFTATFRPELLKDIEDVKQAMNDENVSILDARSADRFAGQTPEGRPGLRSGHIPNSQNTPFMQLISANDGRLKPAAELSAIFQAVNLRNEIINTCGSGVTACVVALALHHIGTKDTAVYDGSWTEWGEESRKTEVATLP